MNNLVAGFSNKATKRNLYIKIVVKYSLLLEKCTFILNFMILKVQNIITWWWLSFLNTAGNFC
jgi:hypothetical protein